MHQIDIVTRPESPSDDPPIGTLQSLAFGPGAYARAAFRVREQAPHDRTLSFVTERGGTLIGSVRMTWVAVAADRGLLLGPLVVDPDWKGLGYGKALVRHAVAAAGRAAAPFVVLVGDEPYYGPLGFKPLPAKRVVMPGPVDPDRLLAAELVAGVAATLAGTLRGVGSPLRGSASGRR